MKKIALLLIVFLLSTSCAFAEGETTQTMTLKLTVPDRTISIYTGEHIGVRIGEEVVKESEGNPVQFPAPRLEDTEIQLVVDECYEIEAVTFDAGEASVGSYDAENAKLTFLQVPADETIHIVERVSDWEWHNNEDGTTCTISKYVGTETEVTVPADIYNRQVIALSTGTFADCAAITKVTIPYTVTTVASDCFGAEAQVTIACHEDSAAHTFATSQGFATEVEEHTGTPAGCVTTGLCDICGMVLTPHGHDIAFAQSVYETYVNTPIDITITRGCEDALGTITWTGAEDGVFTATQAGYFTVTAQTEDAYTEAISCKVIVHTTEALKLPAALVEIEDEAFANNTQIAEVVLPAKCVCIGNKAFANCASLKIISLPDTLVTIADDAFEGCSSDVLFLCSTQAQADYANEKGFQFILESGE